MAIVSHAEVIFAKFAKKIQLVITVLNANQDTFLMIIMIANHVLKDAIHAQNMVKQNALHAKVGFMIQQIVKVNTNVIHVLIFAKSVMGQISKIAKYAKMDTT